MKKLFLFLTAVICLAMSAHAQRTVTGTVVDAETDEPLVAATVLPIGGGTGTITDIDGNFSLNLPGSVKEIKFSYVGYATQTVAVSDKMTIALVPDNKLETVVVTGYGSGKELGSVVGAVSVVGEDQFQNIPTATFVDALQGQVSGLSIYSNSGDPSSVNNGIRLRGVNSIYADNTPLFILDGAPVSESVFTTMNPADIESVTVLKDAASVAIYGARAANGVIVITSKKGKFGEKARVSIRANVGWSQLVEDKGGMMNADQYVRYRELANPDLVNTEAWQDVRRAVYDFGIDTNWRDETFDGHAPLYSIDATIKGGSESFSYYVGLNHYSAEGIISQSAMRREALRLNLSARVAPWLRLSILSNLGYSKYQTNNESNAIYSGTGLYGSNPMAFARMAMPYDSPYYYTIDENGRPVYGDRAQFLHYTQKPTPAFINEGRRVWRNKLTINTTLVEELTPIDGLRIRAQQNVDAYDLRIDNIGFAHDKDLVTPMDDHYNYDGDLGGYNQQSFGRYYAFTYTNTAEYNRLFNDVHDVTVLIGQESIISKSDSFGALADGYTDNRMLLLNLTPATLSGNNLTQSIENEVFNSVFANLSYSYDNKYFIEGSYRRDGSSKFAPGHRWSNFWAVGGMWNIKNENFMTPITWVDNLQFHVSYGTTGNSGIDNYAYFGSVGPYGVYNGATGTGLLKPSNHSLTWETVKSFDIGINFGFLNIFSGEIDFYNKVTEDLLMPIPYSFTTGYDNGFGNIGDMRNRGIDFNIQADIFKTRDWYWALRANLNYNQNRILSLFDDQDEYTIADTGTTFKVGKDAGSLYYVRYAGVDPRDGLQMWYDKDGNLTKTFNEERDAVILNKSLYAPLSGGFGTDVRWKNLSLKVDFTWAAKKYMANNDSYFTFNNVQAASYNQNVHMLNLWTKPGDITDVPRADQAPEFDSRFVEDASFLRLKNLTLQYSLPQNLLNKMRIDGLTFHFSGRNLLTFTSFTGYDPEPEMNLVTFLYPNTRQYEFGVEVSF